MFKRLMIFLLAMAVILSAVSCSDNGNTNTASTQNASASSASEDDEEAKREAEEAKAKKEAEEKMIAEAKATAEGFLNEFLTLDLKGMLEYTDVETNYAEMPYLSLEEYKRELLSEFTVFSAMGLPLDGFSGIVDTVLKSYEEYSSYKIINSAVDGDDVVFDVKVEYIRAETMENILNNAVNKVNTDELATKVAGTLLISGFSGDSLSNVIQKTLTPIVESLNNAVMRSVDELTPEKGTMKLRLSYIDYEWVIRDEGSEVDPLTKIFERTQQNAGGAEAPVAQ